MVEPMGVGKWKGKEIAKKGKKAFSVALRREKMKDSTDI